MIFSWLRRWRRRKLLAHPFDARWLDYLARHLPHYARLTPTEQSKLRDDVRVFVAERHWEGCGGLMLTEEMQVAIAAQACLLTLGLHVDLFNRVRTVLVYPTGYVAPDNIPIGSEIAMHGEAFRLGETMYRGPVILSWEDAREGGALADEGDNLVLHEFAHQLDLLDGIADGIPPLADHRLARRWKGVMEAEFDRLVRSAQRGRATLLDHYGATDEAEFFAVATECFFQRPVEMRAEHPRLYQLLAEIYRQDPAGR